MADPVGPARNRSDHPRTPVDPSVHGAYVGCMSAPGMVLVTGAFGTLGRSLLRLSAPYRGAPPRPTWRALIDAGY